MEDVLDWLQRAEAISNSRRRKILDNETEEGFAPSNEDLVVRLMEELRNGIALATLATKLDKSISFDKVETRPSMLWQRDHNIKLFLNACAKRDVKAAFDRDDVDKGTNAGEVIKTINRVAKKLAKDGTVADINNRERLKAFIAALSADGKSTLQRPYSRDAASKIYAHGYDIFKGSGANHNKNGNYYGTGGCDIGSGDSGQADYYYREHIAMGGAEEAVAGKTQLENNIAELLGNETRYVQKMALLPAIVENYENHRSLVFRLLKDNAGITKEVLELHGEIKESLAKAPPEDIPLVLKSFKNRLLIYGPFIQKCSNTWNTLRDNRGELAINKEIEAVRKKICARDATYAYLDEHERKHSSTDTVPLQELLCPFQHVLRYQLMLETMSKSAKKQIESGEAEGEQAWVNKFYENVKEGLIEMRDLNEYLNEYRRDSEILSDYAKGLDPKKVRFDLRGVKGFEAIDLKRFFGVLKFQDFLEHKVKARPQSSSASLRKSSSGKDKFKPKYLLAFQESILICNIELDEEGEEIYSVMRWINTRAIKDITVHEAALTLTLLVVDRETLSVVDECVLKVKNAKALGELKSAFMDLTKMLHSPQHPSCQVGEWEINKVGYQGHLPPAITCDLKDCGMLLRGRITVGIRCVTCAKVYHEECFFQGKSVYNRNISEMSIFAEDDDEDIHGTGENESFWLGESADKDDLRDSALFPAGTYLIYQDQDQIKMAIKTKLDGSGEAMLKKYFIDRSKNGRFKVRGKDVTAARSLRELVNNCNQGGKFSLGRNYVELLAANKNQEQHGEISNSDGEDESQADSAQPKMEKARRSLSTDEMEMQDMADDYLRLHVWPHSQANRELLLTNPQGTFLITKGRGKIGITSYDIYYVRNRKTDQRKKVSKKTIVRNEDGSFRVEGDEEAETYPTVEAYIESQPQLFITPLLPNNDLQAEVITDSSRTPSTRSSDSGFGATEAAATPVKSTAASHPRRPSDFPSSLSTEAPSTLRTSPMKTSPQRTRRLSAAATPAGASKRSSPQRIRKPSAASPSTAAGSFGTSQRRSSGSSSYPPPLPSLDEELRGMNFYVGTMARDEAARILSSQPPGTYLLRRNDDGDLRVTLRRPGTSTLVAHIRIESNPDIRGYGIGSTKARTLEQLFNLFREPGRTYHFDRPFVQHRYY